MISSSGHILMYRGMQVWVLVSVSVRLCTYEGQKTTSVVFSFFETGSQYVTMVSLEIIV